MEKSQKYPTKINYTKEVLKLGHVGETIDYKIVVKNTGNVPLELNFKDPNCDEGTIEGGPGEEAVPPAGPSNFASTTPRKAEEERGGSCNTANATGTDAEPHED